MVTQIQTPPMPTSVGGIVCAVRRFRPAGAVALRLARRRPRPHAADRPRLAYPLLPVNLP